METGIGGTNVSLRVICNDICMHEFNCFENINFKCLLNSNTNDGAMMVRIAKEDIFGTDF